MTRSAIRGVAGAVALAAWGLAGSAPPVFIETGVAFSLRSGGTAQVRDGTLQIGFESVTADSRCAKGEQCVWAGDVTVRVWLQRQAGRRETRELHLASRAAASGAPHIRLLRLDPQPVAGRPIAPADYVATLLLTDAPDR